MPPALRPGFSGPWGPPLALSSTLATLIAFAYSSTAGATVLSGHFLTTPAFLPYSPSSAFFTQPAFMKGSLGAGSSSLRFAGLHNDPKNTDLASLFV